MITNQDFLIAVFLPPTRGEELGGNSRCDLPSTFLPLEQKTIKDLINNSRGLAPEDRATYAREVTKHCAPFFLELALE